MLRIRSRSDCMDGLGISSRRYLQAVEGLLVDDVWS